MLGQRLVMCKRVVGITGAPATYRFSVVDRGGRVHEMEMRQQSKESACGSDSNAGFWPEHNGSPHCTRRSANTSRHMEWTHGYNNVASLCVCIYFFLFLFIYLLGRSSTKIPVVFLSHQSRSAGPGELSTLSPSIPRIYRLV